MNDSRLKKMALPALAVAVGLAAVAALVMVSGSDSLIGGENEAPAATSAASDVPATSSATTAMAPQPVVAPADAPVIEMYKTATCGCCGKWAEHLEAAGFRVVSHDVPNLGEVKAAFGVPGHLQSCHTAKVGDYLVEGHVPAEDVAKMLEEQPEVAGISVPGMPIGSPGMEYGDQKDPYDVIAFEEDGTTEVFSRHNH